MKRFIFGGIVLAALAGAGCEVETRPATVGIGVEADLGPDQVYYDRGAYVGSYWVWHDHAGHEMREERAMHERRVAHVREHRAHEEHHEEHHDEHH